MPTLTIRNVPPSLMERLKLRAARERRSLNQEITYLLEQAVEEERYRPEAQVAAWADLGGQWRPELEAVAERRAIYEARSDGREVEL